MSYFSFSLSSYLQLAPRRWGTVRIGFWQEAARAFTWSLYCFQLRGSAACLTRRPSEVSHYVPKQRHCKSACHMKTLLKKSMFIAVSLALFTCTCLMLSACAANATSAPEIPRTSGEDQPAPMNISTQVSSDVIADENCLPGGPSDTQPEYWKIEEFEVWMEQQRDQIQKLADN